MVAQKNLLKAWVTLLLSAVMNLVGLTILAGPQVYPGPGAFRVKFFGTLTVLLVVPAAPTLTWNELTALAGSWAHEFITPPLQQFAICWL